jgi:hypothetical protein
MDAKKMLSNPKLLELLKSYPKDKISEKQIKNVKKYVYTITPWEPERRCAVERLVGLSCLLRLRL